DKNVCPGLPTPKTLSVCGPDIPVWPEGRRQECLLRFAHSKNVVHVGQTFLSGQREADKNVCSGLPHQKRLSVWARHSCLARGRQTSKSAPVCPHQKRCLCVGQTFLSGQREADKLLQFAHSKSLFVCVGQTFLSGQMEA